MATQIHLLRREYSGEELNTNNASTSPFDQFTLWFTQALNANVVDPNAMTLATASKKGKPSARIVLLKEYSENGFSFFTNYVSRKGSEISENPFASLLFYWHELNRQIRIEGTLTKLSKKASDEYFSSRPRESRLAAFVSEQSKGLKNRKELDEKFKSAESSWENKEIPRPDAWGGYILSPNYFEFWQGRENRLHDRVCYTSIKDKWQITQLYP